MSRRHSLPAEVYALVEHTPATVLLECGKAKQDERPNAESCTRIFTAPVRVCVANTAAEIAELFGEIESAVASGLTRGGILLPTSAEVALSQRQECARAERRPAAGLVRHLRARAIASIMRQGRFLTASRRAGALSRRRRRTPGTAELADCEAALGLTEEQYAERIAAIHEWIRAGDVYQLNFTVPYNVRVRGSVAALYARLRARQPVEYGAFLHWRQGRRILSFSPELFFRVDEENGSRRITTKPMKGTAARGRTTREDRERAEWLRNDPKNRSENVMIVDLLRNDLGRLAKFGSVRAENLFAVERYPTLWQMTSTVTGELRAEVGFHEIFRALFPCGSITGAPKVRAMQLLAELEEQTARRLHGSDRILLAAAHGLQRGDPHAGTGWRAGHDGRGQRYRDRLRSRSRSTANAC